MWLLRLNYVRMLCPSGEQCVCVCVCVRVCVCGCSLVVSTWSLLVCPLACTPHCTCCCMLCTSQLPRSLCGYLV